jgi:hypothetical protein
MQNVRTPAMKAERDLESEAEPGVLAYPLLREAAGHIPVPVGLRHECHETRALVQDGELIEQITDIHLVPCQVASDCMRVN